MERKICTNCNLERNIEDFYNKYTERKICNSITNLGRFYENKDNISNQKKVYFEKK